MKQCYSPEFIGQVVNGETVKFTGRPTTIVQALHEMPLVDWYNMVETIYLADDPDGIDFHDVLQLIQETNTCTYSKTNSIEVWIDEKGDFRIKVYRV